METAVYFSLPAHDDPVDSLSRDSPTKLDREVLLALEGVDIDPLKFPSIHKWRSTMKVYSTSDMLRSVEVLWAGLLRCLVAIHFQQPLLHAVGSGVG